MYCGGPGMTNGSSWTQFCIQLYKVTYNQVDTRGKGWVIQMENWDNRGRVEMVSEGR